MHTTHAYFDENFEHVVNVPNDWLVRILEKDSFSFLAILFIFSVFNLLIIKLLKYIFLIVIVSWVKCDVKRNLMWTILHKFSR